MTASQGFWWLQKGLTLDNAIGLNLDPAGKRSGFSARFCIEAQDLSRSGENALEMVR
jgi:hypothetical protein